MWRLLKVGKILPIANLFIGITFHSATYGQNTFNHGTFITGNDPKIINQLLPDKVIKGLTNLSSRLSVTAINSKNAEAALKNGNYALAADHWGEIAKDELLVKKSKQRWVYAIIKKSESEEYYNISAAHKTVTSALALAPNDITLLEKAAIIEINLYQLSNASENLLKLLALLNKKHENRVETRYLSHLRLAVVSASVGRNRDQIHQTIQATKIFNELLNREQKNKYQEDNKTLLSAAILMQLSRLDTNPDLLTEYRKFEKFNTPESETVHLAKNNGTHWISLESGKVERIPPSAKLETSTNALGNIELIVGNYQLRLVNLLNKFIEEAKQIDDSESAAARKLFHKAYDELIEISATCVNCSDHARRRHFASFILGSYYFEIKDFSTANFFFSKALNEIKGIDAENNNHAILVQAHLLEQISLAREEETQWIGSQFAMQPIYQPLEIAKKLLEKAHFRDPNDGDIISRLIKNSNQLRRVYTLAFNFEKAARECEQAYSLYEQIISNQFLVDTSYGDLYSCQIQLVIHAKQNKLGNELALIERLADIALRSKQISSREELNWLSK